MEGMMAKRKKFEGMTNEKREGPRWRIKSGDDKVMWDHKSLLTNYLTYVVHNVLSFLLLVR